MAQVPVKTTINLSTAITSTDFRRLMFYNGYFYIMTQTKLYRTDSTGQMSLVANLQYQCDAQNYGYFVIRFKDVIIYASYYNSYNYITTYNLTTNVNTRTSYRVTGSYGIYKYDEDTLYFGIGSGSQPVYKYSTNSFGTLNINLPNSGVSPFGNIFNESSLDTGVYGFNQEAWRADVISSTQISKTTLSSVLPSGTMMCYAAYNNEVYTNKGSALSRINFNTGTNTEILSSFGGAYLATNATPTNDGIAIFYSTNKIDRVVFVEYDLTYNIKDKSGSFLYASYTGNSPISKVRFNYSGTYVTYTITTLTGDILGSYTPDIPQGYTLAGFASSPNKTTVEIGLNADITTAISNDFTFYEVYKKYVPPQTTFDIELYQNTADKLVLDKTSFLTIIDTLSGALRDRCDIINPTIIIEYNAIPDFNYVHIPIWERYYYVDKIVSVRFGLWEISLTLDERFSYKDEILSQTDLLIARSESLNWYNPYLVDEMIPTEAGTIKTVTEIPNTSLSSTESTYPFVVAVIGATP